MFKKLLTLAAFMAVGVGWGNLAHAQTDVTATYITNPSFELGTDGTPASTAKGYNAPYAWTAEGLPTSGTHNFDILTANENGNTSASGFGTTVAPAEGTYYYFGRHSWSTALQVSFSQETAAALPKGTYVLDVAYKMAAKDNNTGGNLQLKAIQGETTLGNVTSPTSGKQESDYFNTAGWTRLAVPFTVTSSGKVTLQIVMDFNPKKVNTAQEAIILDDVRLFALDAATTSDPADVTGLLTNASFELNTFTGTRDGSSTDTEGSRNFPSGWTFMLKSSGWNNCINVTDAPSHGMYARETWAGTINEFKVYQTLNSLPAGLYEVCADARTNDGNANSICTYGTENGEAKYSTPWDVSQMVEPWNGAGNWQTLSATFNVFENGATTEVGLHSYHFMQFDNFRLYYRGSIIGGKAVPFTSGETMEANTWYYFDVPAASNYLFTAGTNLNSIVYTTDGTILLENAASVDSKFMASQDVEVTRYYFKSSEAQTFTFGPSTYSYTVGDATSDIADGAYIQSLTTWTLEYALATSDDPDATFALVDGSAKAVLAKGGTPVAEGTLSLDGNTLTATFDGVTLDKESAYTLSLPANVVGYEGQEANAAVSVAVNTPAVFDGTYYLYNDLTKRFIGRGMTWGTRAVVDKYGIAVNLATGTDGFTTIQFVDDNAYMKNTWWLYADGALADANTFKVIASTVEGAEGYHFATQQVSANLNDKKYLYVYTKDDNDKYACAGNSTMDDNISDWKQTVWQLKTDAERDAIVDAYPTENISNVIAASGVETTAANFETYLSENYTAIDHTDKIGTATFSGAIGDWTWTGTDRTQKDQPAYGNGYAEVWNATGTYTQTIAASELPAGFYKLTFQGYERRRDNNTSATLGDAGYNFVSSYVAANNEQVRFTDWYNVPERPTNVDGALTAFAAGYAKNEVFVYLDGETDLTIKVAKPNYIWDCWIIFNNFTLTYYKDKASIVYATDITLDQTSAALTTGETVTLTATVKPENADDQSVTWTSSDATVATVANGVVTALKPGSATITASANGGEDITASATITVADAAAPAFFTRDIEDGVDYYIMNAATGKFLGGGNNWGTHASLIEHGIPFTVALANGKYTLDSHTYDNANKHFLNENYVDGSVAEYYISGEEGIFNISKEENTAYVTATAVSTLVSEDGTDANSTLAKWYFLSKADRDKMLAAATPESPADATYYIKEANFSRNLATTGQGVSGWTGTKTYGGGGGEYGSTNYNARVEGAVADVYQTIENIPNGIYTVKMQGCVEGDAIFYAKSAEEGSEEAIITDAADVTDDVTASAAFSAGKYVNTLTITVTGHTLTLGVKSAEPVTKLFFDNFELYMTGYTPVTEVTASIDNSEIEVSGTAQITASVTEGASFDAISYESSDVTVATVDENGLVTAVAEGTATITVKAEMENKSEEINVMVVLPAILPEEIAVKNGDDIITELELDATTNEVTLTAVVGPAGAPQAVVWASDDENVATVSAEGVVTGVAPGTASITVTASGYDDVYATVEVTVTYPESTIPATVEVIDETEMTKTIYTLAQENLIKNGSFEYPNAFYGWTAADNNALSTTNFEILTTDAPNGNAYLHAKNHGANDSNASIGTKWAIEHNKTYIFGYETKVNTDGNATWHKVSLTSNPNAEQYQVSKDSYPLSSTEWTKVQYKFESGNYDYLQFRARWLSSNTSFDNFYLAEVTNAEVTDLSATADDYAALNEAIESKTLGFLEGEYAPYNNVGGVQALNAAKAIDQSVKNWADDVKAATEAINDATWTANTEEVNAVYDGTFENAKNNGAPAGWTMSNNTLGGDYHARAFVGDERLSEFNGTNSGFFLRFDGVNSSRGSLYHYGKTAGYTMPLKANTTYYVKVDVAGWGSTGKPIRLNVTGPEDFTAQGQQFNTNVNAESSKDIPQVFYILFTTGETEGNYTISFQTPGSDDNKHNVVVSNIELKSSLDVTMTIKVDNEYGTFFAPFDVDIPQGVKAYTVESVNDKDELELIEVTSTIPANTPVIIYKNEFTAEEVANKVFTETFHGINLIANTETEGTNLLTGVYYRQLAPENSYVLQNIDEKVAFYHVEAGGQPTMRAYSAYLNYTEPNSAKSLSFGDDEATAIAGIEALTSGNMEGIYTTSGAKVNSLQKGVNIIRTKDGKSMKVYVK